VQGKAENNAAVRLEKDVQAQAAVVERTEGEAVIAAVRWRETEQFGRSTEYQQSRTASALRSSGVMTRTASGTGCALTAPPPAAGFTATTSYPRATSAYCTVRLKL
jgi:hypothetical protein